MNRAIESKRYTIGIDPGKNTGFAVYDRQEKKLIEVKTGNFWSVIMDIDVRFHPESVFRVAVEIPSNKHVWHKGAKKRGAIERTGVNVGSAIREAELIHEWLVIKGYDAIKAKPAGKNDKGQFRRITGWDKQTNQHSRDAGMLCFGV